MWDYVRAWYTVQLGACVAAAIGRPFFVQTYTYGIVRATITEYFTSGVAEAINAAGISYAVVINARATRQLFACDV